CSHDYGNHAGFSESLGINKAVHSQSYHDKKTAQQIDGYVVLGIGNRGIRCTEKIQKGPFKNQPQDSKDQTEEDHQDKGIAHDSLRFLDISFSALDGAEGSPSHAEQIGKGYDD